MTTLNKRRALGRGLTTLIPVESEELGSGNDTVMVDANAIAPNPFQPRVDFNEEEIRGLAESIKAQGLLQPVIVRKKLEGYEIVSGERRVRAMRSLGWDKVPCIVKPKVSDREMLELALVENIQREDLNDIETAAAFQRLLLECNLSHEKLSERVGKSRSAISNTLRLLNLPAEIQEMVRKGLVSTGHARALLAVDEPAKQKELARRVIDEGLSVREVEAQVQQVKGGENRRKPPASGTAHQPAEPSGMLGDPNLKQALEQLQYLFGTTVKVSAASENRGKIEIAFHSLDDLNRILDLLRRQR